MLEIKWLEKFNKALSVSKTQAFLNHEYFDLHSPET